MPPPQPALLFLAATPLLAAAGWAAGAAAGRPSPLDLAAAQTPLFVGLSAVAAVPALRPADRFARRLLAGGWGGFVVTAGGAALVVADRWARPGQPPGALTEAAAVSVALAAATAWALTATAVLAVSHRCIPARRVAVATWAAAAQWLTVCLLGCLLVVAVVEPGPPRDGRVATVLAACGCVFVLPVAGVSVVLALSAADPAFLAAWRGDPPSDGPDCRRRRRPPNAGDHLAAGAPLVWLTHPTRRTVVLIRPDPGRPVRSGYMPQTRAYNSTRSGGRGRHRCPRPATTPVRRREIARYAEMKS